MYREHDNKTVISLAGLMVLTLLTSVAAWLPAFLFAPTFSVNEGGGILFRAITAGLVAHPLLSMGITMALLLVLGIVQCVQSSNYRLVKTSSLLPVFFILLLPGLFVSEHTLSPGIFSAVCLYMAFTQIITPCTGDDAQWRSLEMGFFIALATLFAPTCLFYLPLFWVGMYLLNRFTLLNLFASVIGCITPYILLAGFLFLTDQQAELSWQWNVLSHQFCIQWLWSLHEVVLLALLAVALLVAFMGFLQQRSDRIHPRAIAAVAYVLAMGAWACSLLYHKAHHTIILVVFASLCLTQYFTHRSKKLTIVYFYSLIALLLFVYGTQFIG